MPYWCALSCCFGTLRGPREFQTLLCAQLTDVERHCSLDSVLGTQAGGVATAGAGPGCQCPCQACDLHDNMSLESFSGSLIESSDCRALLQLGV